MTNAPKHYEVSGPGRDYDSTTFCAHCWPEALQCAKDWLEEAADGLDVEDIAKVEVAVCHGAPEHCYGFRCRSDEVAKATARAEAAEAEVAELRKALDGAA